MIVSVNNVISQIPEEYMDSVHLSTGKNGYFYPNGLISNEFVIRVNGSPHYVFIEFDETRNASFYVFMYSRGDYNKYTISSIGMALKIIFMGCDFTVRGGKIVSIND